MANVKITELTAATALAGTDVLPIVDVGADATKKVSVSDLLRNLPDGTASAPALAFADDQNTGLLSPGDNSLAFATSGTQRLLIDSSGKIEYSHNTYLTAKDSAGSGYVELLKANASNQTVIANNKNAGIVFVNTNTSELARIDSSGRLLIGTTSADTVAGDSNLGLYLKSDTHSKLVCIRTKNDTAGGELRLGKTKASGSASALVSNNDNIGRIRFCAGDGTDLNSETARISSFVDGTPGSNDMPGRLVFLTTADGASSPIERLRIDSNGVLISSHATINGGVIGTNGNELRLQSDINANGTPFTSFYVGSGEKARIDSTGRVLVGKTTDAFDQQGIRLHPTSDAHFTRNSGPVVAFRRNTNDGTILSFYQDGNQEGTISVSGNTVSYNGAHLARWSQLASAAARIEILRGSVLSNLDEMCEWGDEDNEQLNRMKVSDVEGDVNVSGVFQGWDDDDDTYTNDFYCAMTGDFVVRVAQGITVARGDLLMSAGDGTAKPQDDDIVRSKTIAKVTSTTVSATYADGSYCVPCVLMAC